MANTGWFPPVSNALDIMVRQITPNPKCNGCLHYETHRIACLVGLMPQNCGNGEEPHLGYAPLSELKPGTPHMSAVASPQVAAPQPPTAHNQGLENLPVAILGDEAPQVAAVVNVIAQQAMAKAQSGCIACHRGPMSGAVNVALAGIMSAPHTCEYEVTESMVKSVFDRVSPRFRVKLEKDEVEAMLEEQLETLSKGLFQRAFTPAASGQSAVPSQYKNRRPMPKQVKNVGRVARVRPAASASVAPQVKNRRPMPAQVKAKSKSEEETSE